MNRSVVRNRRRLLSGLLLFFFTLPTLLPTPAAHAQGGIALAGTFHLQEYELPQGTEISHPSIHLVVFNHGDEPMKVSMRVDTPFGVEVLMDETEFTLEPDDDRKLLVTVRVSEDAVPGEYDLIITATSAPAGTVSGTGARLATASAQKASLVVTGAAARVKARVVTPDGFPVRAQVRLFKVLDERLNDICQTETGEMDVAVSPGKYRLVVYIAGRRLAEEDFEIGADETREFELTVRTAYFEQFGIEPNYIESTGQLSFVRMVYTISNLSGPLEDVEVILRVHLDGELVEEVSLMTLGHLEMGRTGGSASYVPAAGWQEGKYTFKIDLNVEGEFYIESSLQELAVTPEDVGAPSAALPSIISHPFGIDAPAPGGVSIIWWMLVGVLIIALAVVFLLGKRRRPAPEKPEEPVAPPPAEEEEAEVPVEEVAPPPVEEEEAEVPVEEAPEEEEELPQEEVPPEEEAEEVPEGEIEEPTPEEAEERDRPLDQQ